MRYTGKITVCISQLELLRFRNEGEDPALADERKARLAARLVRLVLDAEPGTTTVTVDFPHDGCGGWPVTTWPKTDAKIEDDLSLAVEDVMENETDWWAGTGRDPWLREDAP